MGDGLGGFLGRLGGFFGCVVGEVVVGRCVDVFVFFDGVVCGGGRWGGCGCLFWCLGVLLGGFLCFCLVGRDGVGCVLWVGG